MASNTYPVHDRVANPPFVVALYLRRLNAGAAATGTAFVRRRVLSFSDSICAALSPVGQQQQQQRRRRRQDRAYSQSNHGGTRCRTNSVDTRARAEARQTSVRLFLC